jgi:hypothetical protein
MVEQLSDLGASVGVSQKPSVRTGMDDFRPRTRCLPCFKKQTQPCLHRSQPYQHPFPTNQPSLPSMLFLSPPHSPPPTPHLFPLLALVLETLGTRCLVESWQQCKRLSANVASAGSNRTRPDVHTTHSDNMLR